LKGFNKLSVPFFSIKKEAEQAWQGPLAESNESTLLSLWIGHPPDLMTPLIHHARASDHHHGAVRNAPDMLLRARHIAWL
jgi:hypothetical protein